jgi:hypothetical protein
MYLDSSVGLGAGVGGRLTNSTVSVTGSLLMGSPLCGGVDGAGVGNGAGTCRIWIGSGRLERYVGSRFDELRGRLIRSIDVRLGLGRFIVMYTS